MEDEKLAFNTCQQLLESLKDSDTAFMFVSSENHFTIKEHDNDLLTEILFAMLRYPEVENLIKNCAVAFDKVNAKYGQLARAVEMDHLIYEKSKQEE
jgi:hypothetical protein